MPENVVKIIVRSDNFFRNHRTCVVHTLFGQGNVVFAWTQSNAMSLVKIAQDSF